MRVGVVVGSAVGLHTHSRSSLMLNNALELNPTDRKTYCGLGSSVDIRDGLRDDSHGWLQIQRQTLQLSAKGSRPNELRYLIVGIADGLELGAKGRLTGNRNRAPTGLEMQRYRGIGFTCKHQNP